MPKKNDTNHAVGCRVTPPGRAGRPACSAPGGGPGRRRPDACRPRTPPGAARSCPAPFPAPPPAPGSGSTRSRPITNQATAPSSVGSAQNASDARHPATSPVPSPAPTAPAPRSPPSHSDSGTAVPAESDELSASATEYRPVTVSSPEWCRARMSTGMTTFPTATTRAAATVPTSSQANPPQGRSASVAARASSTPSTVRSIPHRRITAGATRAPSAKHSRGAVVSADAAAAVIPTSSLIRGRRGVRPVMGGRSAAAAATRATTATRRLGCSAVMARPA